MRDLLDPTHYATQLMMLKNRPGPILLCACPADGQILQQCMDRAVLVISVPDPSEVVSQATRAGVRNALAIVPVAESRVVTSNVFELERASALQMLVFSDALRRAVATLLGIDWVEKNEQEKGPLVGLLAKTLCLVAAGSLRPRLEMILEHQCDSCAGAVGEVPVDDSSLVECVAHMLNIVDPLAGIDARAFREVLVATYGACDLWREEVAWRIRSWELAAGVVVLARCAKTGQNRWLSLRTLLMRYTQNLGSFVPVWLVCPMSHGSTEPEKLALREAFDECLAQRAGVFVDVWEENDVVGLLVVKADSSKVVALADSLLQSGIPGMGALAAVACLDCGACEPDGVMDRLTVILEGKEAAVLAEGSVRIQTRTSSERAS